jgi:hypothetical protein
MPNVITEVEDGVTLIKTIQGVLSDPQFQSDAQALISGVEEGIAMFKAITLHAESLYNDASPAIKELLEKAVPSLAQTQASQ